MRRSTWCCVSLESLPIEFYVCLIALLPLPTPSSAAHSTPNTRTDSVFENPTTTAKLTIQPAIRLCQRLVQVGQLTHPHCRQDAPDARKKGGSGDQIALKDGKHLLVVQYIWPGPFRASAMRRTKIAAVPAASDGGFFAVAKVTRQCQARTTTSISLSNRQSSTRFRR